MEQIPNVCYSSFPLLSDFGKQAELALLLHHRAGCGIVPLPPMGLMYTSLFLSLGCGFLIAAPLQPPPDHRAAMVLGATRDEARVH